MRLLYLDVDTLRPDHLGCYGYHRRTSPNIDRLAAQGVRFEQVYVSDSPCLPSRTALVTGRFGIRNGVVNHGGQRAELFGSGRQRPRQSELARTSWPALLRQAGLWCASISTFAERHSAFHWYAGFNETLNLGTDGKETADQVEELALDWLLRHGRREDWFLHVHFWDPHTPYRTPLAFGEPFAGEPLPAWLTEDVLAAHWLASGPHSAQEVLGFGPLEDLRRYLRQPQQVADLADARRMVDGYDTGVLFADQSIGRLLDQLENLGVAEETAVLLSSDHGENLGELAIYCDHQTADQLTHHVPLLLRWPDGPAGRTDRQLHYQVDVAATVAELAGASVPEDWDGASFAPTFGEPQSPARDHLVLSCAAWTTQRAVRFDDWLAIRTYDDAFHGFPEWMLFDLLADPHEQHDRASEEPAVLDRAGRLLVDWEAQQMARSPSGTDPLWTVMAEGGGYYTRDRLEPYLRRLEATGRGDQAKRIIEGRR